MKAYYFQVLHWKMVAKIAGVHAMRTKACAIGVARMVGVVDKIGLPEMDVMAHLGDLDTTFVSLNHQVFYDPRIYIFNRQS